MRHAGRRTPAPSGRPQSSEQGQLGELLGPFALLPAAAPPRDRADSLPCTRTQPFIYIYKMTQPPLKIRGKVECARHSQISPASRLSARMDALRVLADLALVGVALLFLWRGASNAVVAWRSSKRKLGKQD
jgi:hypothetical protein